MATFRPSAYPVSPRPWRKALTRLANTAGDSGPRYPITGIAGCCARAVSGHVAAAAPQRVINSRRLTSDIGFSALAISMTGRDLPQRTVGARHGHRTNAALVAWFGVELF